MPFDMEMSEYKEDMELKKSLLQHCLVTGGAGFIGTNLIKRLLKDGHTVVSVDNYSTGNKDNHQDGVVYVDGDVSNESTWDKLKDDDYDVVFHMAALARIKPSFKNPTEVINANVNGTANTLQFARDKDIPLIFAGSSSFHGGVYKNPYTFSKWEAEELCRLYQELFKSKISICRFYNVYGDYMIDEGSYRTVLSIFLNQIKNDEVLTITSDGKQRRDFTHVDDIVDAMVKIFNQESYGHIFELGRGKNYSMKEVVMMISKLSSKSVSWTFIPEIVGEMRDTLCESKLARDILGWTPKRNLKSWLKEKLI